MVGRNRAHPPGKLKHNQLSPQDERTLARWMRERPAEVKKGLGVYSRFWGVKFPTKLIERADGPNVTLAHLGRTPALFASTEPKGKRGKQFTIRGAKDIFSFPSGKRWVILSKGSQKDFGKDLRLVGYARETHYIPSAKLEKLGSHKKFHHWVHKMGEEGGTWPKVYEDAAGNFIYEKGSYTIDRDGWMRD